MQAALKLPKIGKSRIFDDLQQASEGRYLKNQSSPNRRIFMNTEDKKQIRLLEHSSFDRHVHEQLKNLNEFKNRL